MAARVALELKGIERHYGQGETLLSILKGADFTLKSGETVALVGHTGAGKSSLVHLLTRFYEYDQGDILVDGRSIRELPKGALRSAVGMVTQESFLFNGTGFSV